MNKEMLIAYLKRSGYLKSPAVIAAFKNIPRENFLPPELKDIAYEDTPLQIGYYQTISAPHMYAIMLELAEIKKGEKVLEIGTGSGYGAALISKLVGEERKRGILKHSSIAPGSKASSEQQRNEMKTSSSRLSDEETRVFSIEIIPELAAFAARNLIRSKINNVEVIVGNGNLGLAKEAPFDKIIVTAGAPEIPKELIRQLKEGGKIVIPVGSAAFQELLIGVKTRGKMEYTNHGDVIFVPLVGFSFSFSKKKRQIRVEKKKQPTSTASRSNSRA
jgi:protein-L-isoaspartate(D-aspartate) O-methyltransferase